MKDKKEIRKQIEMLKANYYVYAMSNHLSPKDYHEMHKIGQEFLELELKLREGE